MQDPCADILCDPLLQLQLSLKIITVYILPSIGGLMLAAAAWSLLASPVGAITRTPTMSCLG